MITIKVALPEDRIVRLKEMARQRGVSPGAVAREGIERLLKIKQNGRAKLQSVRGRTRAHKTRVGKNGSSSLKAALGLFATNNPPPTDKEIERMLDERRRDKYGC